MLIFQLLLLILPVFAADCDPLTSSCTDDTALASTFKENFVSGAAPYFSVSSNPGNFSFGSTGVSLTVEKEGDNPTIMSNFYIMFGKVEVVLQAAQGQGIVSSFYLQSDDLDEIDIELFGGDPYEFESNFFSKGNTTDFNRGGYHPTSSDPTENFHTYTLEWTQYELTWSLDGEVVRVLESTSPQGFPQSPMRIYSGAWAGGSSSNSQGTINWAGGLTDFSDAPFTMYIKSLIVADYSTGKSYSYSDNSGSWTSISAASGEILGRQETADEEFASLQDSVSSGIATSTSVSFTPDTTLSVQSLLATAGPTGTQAAQAGKHQSSGSGLTFIITADATATTSASASGPTVLTFLITLENGSTAKSVSTKTTLSTKTTSAASSSRVSSSVSISPIIIDAPISAAASGVTTVPTYANHPLTATDDYSSFDVVSPTFKEKNQAAMRSFDSQVLSFITLLTMFLF